MRFGFVTCVQLGLSCLEEISGLGANPDLVVTLRDDMARSKSGRVYLDKFCQSNGVPLVKVRHINDDESVEALTAANLDWLFIIGWSQIAGPAVLESPRLGCVGMHPTLLPQGRGRAAVPWAIIKGLDRTGVSMFVLDAGVDTGPLIAQEEVPVAPSETATTLYAKVTDAHTALIRRTWPDFASGSVVPVPQDEAAATVWPGRTPEDGQIEPTMQVAEIDALVRALAPPYPGARWIDEHGRGWRVQSGSGNKTRGSVPIPASDGTYYAVRLDPLDAPCRHTRSGTGTGLLYRARSQQ